MSDAPMTISDSATTTPSAVAPPTRVGAKAPAANKINNQIATGTSTSPRGASDQKSSPTSHNAQPSVPSNSAAKSHNALAAPSENEPRRHQQRGAGDPVVGRPADGAEPDAAEEDVETEDRQYSGCRGDDDSSAKSVRHVDLPQDRAAQIAPLRSRSRQTSDAF